MSERRKFFKFAGESVAKLSAAVTFTHLFKPTPAEAQVWQKVNLSGGAQDQLKVRLPQKNMRRINPTIYAGRSNTVVLRSDGFVFCCGDNSNGQLGDNSLVSKNTFVQALGISNALAVSAGGYYNMALRSDGFVFGSGINTDGQLGDNTTLSIRTFIQAVGISNAVAIAAGQFHAMALRSDGFVFGSGLNSGAGYGQLGDNTSTDKSTFVQAVGISNAIAIAAGHTFTMALRSDGLVFSCGDNVHGQLGVGTFASKRTFVQAIGISNAIAIAAGHSHAVALRSDGFVFGCGQNNNGQLGTNSGGSRSTFVQAAGISNAIAVAAGEGHTIALRSDGFVFSCGLSDEGQLGDGSLGVSKSTFVQALGISNAVAISTGFYHNTALRSDGLIFSCGYNGSGRLGDNSITRTSTFVQAVGI